MPSIDYVKLFSPAQLGTSAATYYTVASGKQLRNAVLQFANTTGGAVTVTAYAIDSGGSASDSNAIIKGKSIAGGDTLTVSVPVMDGGSVLQALASAGTSITICALDGMLVTP
jgi:hypothetical protein